jgi:ADP-L-glycero-D-manno-heptose 6-epimerase
LNVASSRGIGAAHGTFRGTSPHIQSVSDKTNIWPRTRVMVTGGAGFIGSAIVWALNRKGCNDIVIADPASRAERRQNLSALRFTDYLEPADMLAKYATGSLGKFDFIFHIGACSSTTETDEEYLRRNNYEFSRDLAGLALSAGARFVYASSAATYGAAAAMDDTAPRHLEDLKPLNPYGRYKHLMDLHAWRQGWLKRIVALKYFNVFGPNENHKGEMRSVVQKSFGQVKESGEIRLFRSYRPEYRDGEQKRDFLYVKDAVAMTLYLAANPKANGIFNLGSGHARTWNDLAGAVFAALGRAPRIKYIEMPGNIREQYQYFTQADIGKLRAAGYALPITPLEDAVRDYVVNYLLPGKSLGSESGAFSA